MEPNADVLGALVKLRVLCLLNGALVVNKNFLRLDGLRVVVGA